MADSSPRLYTTRVQYAEELLQPKTDIPDVLPTLSREQLDRGFDSVAEELRALGVIKKKEGPRDYRLSKLDTSLQEELVARRDAVQRLSRKWEDPGLDPTRVRVDTVVKTHKFELPGTTANAPIKSQLQLRQMRRDNIVKCNDMSQAAALTYFRDKKARHDRAEEQLINNIKCVGSQRLTKSSLDYHRLQSLRQSEQETYDRLYKTPTHDQDRPPWEVKPGTMDFINRSNAYTDYRPNNDLFTRSRPSFLVGCNRDYYEAKRRLARSDVSAEGHVINPSPFSVADVPKDQYVSRTRDAVLRRGPGHLITSLSKEPFPESRIPENYHPIHSSFSRLRFVDIDEKSFLDQVQIPDRRDDFAPLYSSFTPDGYYREPILPQIHIPRTSTSTVGGKRFLSPRGRANANLIVPDRTSMVSVFSQDALGSAKLATSPNIVFE